MKTLRELELALSLLVWTESVGWEGARDWDASGESGREGDCTATGGFVSENGRASRKEGKG